MTGTPHQLKELNAVRIPSLNKGRNRVAKGVAKRRATLNISLSSVSTAMERAIPVKQKKEVRENLRTSSAG